MSKYEPLWNYVKDNNKEEELETAVPLQDVEAILADDHPRQNHADNVRNTQASQDDGRKKNNHQHQEEYPGGVRNGKMYANIR